MVEAGRPGRRHEHTHRGHDSLAVFRINVHDGGSIELATIVPSGGATPRHFNFSQCGRWVIVGNQDSNNITVFECYSLKVTLEERHSIYCPSPNFVCPVLI
jgi:6-phosphogluconolactonase